MESADAFTYSDIYELLRAEKNASDLEPLTVETLVKIAQYIANKCELLERQPGGTFSNAKERSKILSEIDNAQQALRDMFERRQRKVINRAIFSVRTESRLKDTTNMLDFEVKMYEALLKIVESANRSMMTVLEGKCVTGAPSSALKLVDKSLSEDAISTPDAEGKDLKAENQQQVQQIKFLDAIPELVDTDLAKHGPFEAGDIGSLPIELASLLVRQGKAAKIEK